MKVGLVFKIRKTKKKKKKKKNKTTSKSFDNDIVSAKYHVIFPIYDQFRLIQKLDSECMVYKF